MRLREGVTWRLDDEIRLNFCSVSTLNPRISKLKSNKIVVLKHCNKNIKLWILFQN